MSSPNTHRPTLISGQPASAAGGSHRILADMEGRGGRATAAAERAAAATRQRPWPWKWLILAAVATTLLLASLAVFRATSSRDDGVSTASPFAPLPAEPATASHEQDRGAAMIVDDPSASATGASAAAASAQAAPDPAAAAGQPLAAAAAPADAAPAAAGRTP
ncbi:hypothetical protein, partial [Stenotrophomonas sp. MMGLT7]|uniref:hypothetical protein n=1 Tax=Stenotrophomonas sp. MMGLT7 TaxID=2901227 RepID=UPI001E5E9BD1